MSQTIAQQQQRNDLYNQSARTNLLYVGLASIIALIVALINNKLDLRSNTNYKNTLINNELYELQCNIDSYSQSITYNDNLCYIPYNNNCGRLTINNFITPEQSKSLRNIIDIGILYSNGSNSCVSIIDLVSGAVSSNNKFISIYVLYKHKHNHNNNLPKFQKSDIDLYFDTVDRIKHIIYKQFNQTIIYLAKPSFISRITNKPVLTANDEYYHTHVDTQQYDNFVYTALVYLNTHNNDYTGGEFTFVDQYTQVNIHTIQPYIGQLLLFTSGSENIHRVEKVNTGIRYALTIAFTCDQQNSVNEQKLRQKLYTLIE